MVSVTVVVGEDVIGWGWCNGWASSRLSLSLSLYSCCVQLVA